MHLSIPPYLFNLSTHFQGQQDLWQQFSFSNQESLNSFASFLYNTEQIDLQSFDKLANLKSELSSYFTLVGDIHFYVRKSKSIQAIELGLLPNESYFVFSNNFLNEASENQLHFELAQQFALAHLFQLDNFQYHTSARIVDAVLRDYRSPKYYKKSAQNFLSYQQAYCDLACLQFFKAAELVSSFIHQKEPSNTFRLKAFQELASNYEKGLDFIEKKLSEKTSLEYLDIFEQDALNFLCKEVLDLMLQAEFIKTPKVLKLVKNYFPEWLSEKKLGNITAIKAKIEQADISIKEYLCYVLLDLLLQDETIYYQVLFSLSNLNAHLGLKEQWLKTLKIELNLSELMLNDQMKEAQILWQNVSKEDQTILEFKPLEA